MCKYVNVQTGSYICLFAVVFFLFSCNGPAKPKESNADAMARFRPKLLGEWSLSSVFYGGTMISFDTRPQVVFGDGYALLKTGKGIPDSLIWKPEGQLLNLKYAHNQSKESLMAEDSLYSMVLARKGVTVELRLTQVHTKTIYILNRTITM